MDSEQSARLLLIGAVSLVVLIAAGFLVFGWWYSVVRPRNRTVLKVDTVTVSYEAMKRRMVYEYLQSVTYQRSPQILPEGTYQTLVDELIEVTQAGTQGVVLDEAELDQKLRTRVGVGPDADNKLFTDALRRAVQDSGLTESEYRRMITAQVLDGKLRDKFKAEIPPTAMQAKLEAISAPSQDVAKQAIDLINAGEDFATVAKSLSQETDVQTTGGLHDYAPAGSFNAAYDDYAFTGEIGKLSPPLSLTANGSYYVVRIIDRAELPVKDEQKPVMAKKQIADWLQNERDELQASGKLTRDWDQKSQNDALVAVGEIAGPRQQAQQQKQQADQQKADSLRKTTIAQLTSSPSVPQTPQPSDATPAPGAVQDQGGNPTAPAQPVVPGSNGQ
jgi:hypothetical protein